VYVCAFVAAATALHSPGITLIWAQSPKLTHLFLTFYCRQHLQESRGVDEKQTDRITLNCRRRKWRSACSSLLSSQLHIFPHRRRLTDWPSLPSRCILRLPGSFCRCASPLSCCCAQLPSTPSCRPRWTASTTARTAAPSQSVTTKMILWQLLLTGESSRLEAESGLAQYLPLSVCLCVRLSIWCRLVRLLPFITDTHDNQPPTTTSYRISRRYGENMENGCYC